MEDAGIAERETSMGLLYKLFMPRALKRARRKLAKAVHPVRTVRRAVTPRGVRIALNPVGYTKGAIENQIVRSIKGKTKR
jgi:hypothetical protein